MKIGFDPLMHPSDKSCLLYTSMQQSGVRESLREGGLRLLGTLIGVVIGCVYLLIFRFNVWGLRSEDELSIYPSF